MKINVQEFIKEAGIQEPFYPGKRLVHACKQLGQYKGHCVVFDWRNPDKIRVEIKAGTTGRSLEKKDLKYYPVSFQAPTYVDIEVINDNEDLEDEEEEGKSGSGGGGGKKPKKKEKKFLSELKSSAFEAFGEAISGTVPELGKIIDMVVMGKEIAQEAYGQVMETLAQQIDNAKIVATDLIAKAGQAVTKVMPPSFMEPVGNENANYTYDREKNANISFNNSFN